jgi:hypothetical protein
LMGQNNFFIMGVLEVKEENKKCIERLNGLPYVRALIHSGPKESGEVHPVLITGEAANIAYAALEKRPKGAVGILIVGHGSFKSYDMAVLPVIHYLEPFEPNNWMVKLAGWTE